MTDVTPPATHQTSLTFEDVGRGGASNWSRHVTAYGPDSLALLRSRVAAFKADDPLRPVTVVVPTNTVGVGVRRDLAQGGRGIIGLQVLTVRRLAELLGAPRLAGQGRRPSSAPVAAAAVRGELAVDPLVFAPVAKHPATVESLVRAHAELRDVSEEGLDRLSTAGSRARDVVAMHRRVVAALASDFYDDVDLFHTASEGQDPGVLADLGRIIVHLPQRLSRAAASFLRGLATTGGEVVVAWTGFDDADLDIRRSLTRLGLDDTPSAAAGALAPAMAPRIISVSDQDEEARVAVDVILEHARAGVPLDRMAVLVPAPVPYARLVHEALADATVPMNGMGPRSVADRHVGRWVLALLEQAAGRRDRSSIMDLLLATQAPIARQYKGSAASWIKASRDAGVVAGTEQWQTRLARLRDDVGAKGWNTDGVEGLIDAVTDLFSVLDQLAGLHTWPELTSQVAIAVADWLGDPTERDGWPVAERQAADRVIEALDRLAGLASLEPVTSVADVHRTLTIELETDLGRVGQIGRGVHVAPITAALGLDLDVVVILGMSEGVFPTPTSEDALLLDHERETIGDELPARRERVGRQHRQFCVALASAPHQVLIVPRGDLRTTAERVPSRWLRPYLSGDVTHAPAPVQAMPSFAHRVLTSAFPAGPREARLRELGQDAANERPHDATDLYLRDQTLRVGSDLVRARRADHFSRYDGNLSQAASDLQPIVGDDVVVAPTTLEAWVRCPHAAFVTKVLRVRAVENPEERLAISPLDRGIVLHDILERWLLERLEEPLPEPDQPWPATARERLLQIADDQFTVLEQRGLTGHGLLWTRDRARLLHELRLFLVADDQRRAEHGLTPLAAELPFGRDDDAHAPAVVTLRDGRTLRVTGKVDRVDVDRDGRHVVADYKTGRSFDDLIREGADPVMSGTRLQLAIYALGVAGSDARDVRAEYWFTSTKGGFKRVGYVVDGDVVTRLQDVASSIVEMWESGMFVAVPISPDDGKPWIDCDVCDPDGLGTTDVFRRWQVLWPRPELRDFVQLIDPEVADRLDGLGVDA